jgi:NADH-quinone oxidoreductase subunit A
MTQLVLVILIFLAAGLTLLAANLVIGRLVRPDRPSPEKGEVYECGEKPIGSAWVQFDVRFYVVALLFVIFDVELAFFFPWATVFGTANRVANEPDAEVRKVLAKEMQPRGAMSESAIEAAAPPDPAAAKSLAWVAFADIMVFFGVLLVGFAYLWRRGDLEWVRSTAAQESANGHASAGREPIPATTRLQEH